MAKQESGASSLDDEALFSKFPFLEGSENEEPEEKEIKVLYLPEIDYKLALMFWNVLRHFTVDVEFHPSRPHSINFNPIVAIELLKEKELSLEENLSALHSLWVGYYGTILQN